VLSPEETIIAGIGGIRDNALTIRPDLGEFFQVAVSDNGVCVAQRFSTSPDTIPPGPVTDFGVTAELGSHALNWTNPSDADFTGTLIRYRTDGISPQNPSDGILLVDKANVPGSMDSLVHEGLNSQITYSYAAFAHDGTPNHADPVHASGAPFALADFDRDFDVDLVNFGQFQACLTPAGSLVQPGCEDTDLDGDLDVDQQDLSIFLPCLGGAGQAPGC
jgi:hypothetical protein